jgi:protein-tyrosine phosphatase
LRAARATPDEGVRGYMRAFGLHMHGLFSVVGFPDGTFPYPRMSHLFSLDFDRVSIQRDISGNGREGMDITWLTERIAVGGGIWTSDNMAAVARAGITHIVDMQIEFDDTPLAADHGIVVLWNPTDDDFEPKPVAMFERGVDFVERALDEPETKVFIHCAAGVHRAPMMALAVLGVMGWKLGEAMELIQARRPVADFQDVYVRSVEGFLGKR